jgi:hypothetical protein
MHETTGMEIDLTIPVSLNNGGCDVIVIVIVIVSGVSIYCLNYWKWLSSLKDFFEL